MTTERLKIYRLKKGATPDERAVHERQKIERQIIYRLVDELLEGGYELRLHDGENWATPKTTNAIQVKNAFMSVDEETLYVYNKNTDTRYFVFLVYGNDGWDVINDHSVALDDHIRETVKLAEKLEEQHGR